MKLCTFSRGGAAEVGVLRDGGIVPARALGVSYATMNELIAKATAEELKHLAEGEYDGAARLALDSVKVLAPIPEPAQDVLCLGLNYRDHAEEAGGFSKSFTAKEGWPVYFSKRVNHAPGDGDGVPAHENVTSQLDYEVELAVIIGRDAADVAPENARDYVFGYTIVNDMTARELQTRHVQWYFGKSLDGFCPMGPCIVTADEFDFPPALRISSTVNGEPRQDGCTDRLIHGVAEIISQLSQGMTLKAGTIIATGTPKGVAMGMEKPRFLKKGDVIVCEIEGIGRLTNTIV